MPFYIRKHFSAGPIRLNLSRGGLGVSAGVTGARLGINKRGAYVHGGRHGLYYRKYLKDGEGRSTAAGSAPSAPDGSGPVDIFVDTGLTYDSPLARPERPLVEPPALPSAWNRLAAGLGISVFLIAFMANAGSELLLAASLALPFLAVGYGLLVRRHNQRAEALFEKSVFALEERQDLKVALSAVQQDTVGGAQKAWLHYHLYDLLVAACCLDDAAVTADDLRHLEASVKVPEKDQIAIKAGGFARITDMLLADHQLTEEEEQALRALAKRLDLPEDAIQPELVEIDVMALLREEADKPLQPTDCDVRLKRGEECYFQGEGRLLASRVLNRYQRNNVQYREMGYQAEMEGRIYLTNRRILIVDDGTRSYRLNRILDEELSLEDNTLRLTLDGRKNPVILSLPNTMLFAARLERVLGEGR